MVLIHIHKDAGSLLHTQGLFGGKGLAWKPPLAE